MELNPFLNGRSYRCWGKLDFRLMVCGVETVGWLSSTGDQNVWVFPCNKMEVDSMFSPIFIPMLGSIEFLV